MCLLNVLAKHVFIHRAVCSVACLSTRLLALYISVISSIVSFFKLSPTVYLNSLLKSFVKRNISSNKSYVALYTGSSSYFAIFFQKLCSLHSMIFDRFAVNKQIVK